MEEELENIHKKLDDEQENSKEFEDEKLIHYNPKYEIMDKINEMWHNTLKIMSYATLLCAVAMAYFLIQQIFSGVAEENHQPASFFTNKLITMLQNNKSLSKEDFEIYQIFQWGTALSMFAIGIRVMGNKLLGGYFGIYSLISIFFPILFFPMECLGLIFGLYLMLFLGLNGIFVGLYFLGIAQKFGWRKLPGFPGLKKLLLK